MMRHTIESLEAHLWSVGRDMVRDGCSEDQIRWRFRWIVAHSVVEDREVVTWMDVMV